MTKIEMALHALAGGPKTNRDLCEVMDDIGPYVARTMAKLIKSGRVVNLHAGKWGALYALVK